MSKVTKLRPLGGCGIPAQSRDDGWIYIEQQGPESMAFSERPQYRWRAEQNGGPESASCLTVLDKAVDRADTEPPVEVEWMGYGQRAGTTVFGNLPSGSLSELNRRRGIQLAMPFHPVET